MHAVEAMVREGKVQRVGLCNATVEQIKLARNILPIFSVQNK